MMTLSMLCLAGQGSHSKNCTMCSPPKGMMTEGGLWANWMKTCTKISWHRMSKSSKTELMPKRKEAMPRKRAMIAQPRKRLNRFLVLERLLTC